ncbi:TIGR03086: family protein [Actinomadura rubteroloni]|uniref:TIGR03086: family protein n=1 Tax=Actinomadura rubteroloni TaxID=1926885 RepID=A0A2P4UQT9_9ACTN|nr:TIGR03086 family metal-binding protein [Actinomadura rubteroloni]POM27416.1 TIGR03086: family protein [Actinomadura rubteroloni]
MNELHEHMTACAREAARVARGVEGTPLDGATPCTEYDVRALVNHWVLYTSYGLERRARREQIPDELTARDFVAEDGWADAYAAQLDRAVKAWDDPAVWEGDIDFGAGSAPAADVAALIVKEMAVHGWDVAKATGQEFEVPSATGEFLYGVVERNAEMYRQYKGFAEPAAEPAGATAFERALALSGRDPRWTP